MNHRALVMKHTKGSARIELTDNGSAWKYRVFHGFRVVGLGNDVKAAWKNAALFLHLIPYDGE